jgi:hypothetical protein
MKTPEDEAFEDIERKQGTWGGGFNAKRKAAMDKRNAMFYQAYKKLSEDQINYGSSWSKDGERIDPASVYLEEPVQEPVSFPCCGYTDAIKWNQFNGVVQCHMCGQIYTASNAKQCFTTPPQREWVGLTNEDRKAVLLTAYKEWECEELLLCAREDYLLIEQALKEKNT